MNDDAEGNDSVGALIERLEVPDIRTARDAQDELTALLEAECVAASLRRSHVRALNRILGFSARSSWPVFRDVPFVVAVIRAMSIAGDRVTLRHLAALAEKCAQPDVRAAAQKRLSYLEQRLQDTAPLRLLRPSGAESERRGRLVTAAEADGLDLLRPVGG